MMKSKPDEEDYWNSSKFKAFTFDDEDDEFSRVRSGPAHMSGDPQRSGGGGVSVLSFEYEQVHQ